MQENNLRLRLTQQEVEQFLREGKVTTTTQIGPSPVHSLRYSLIREEEAEAVTATFIANSIKVYVPAALAETWARTAQVAIEEQMPLGDDEDEETLQILVEKDFR